MSGRDGGSDPGLLVDVVAEDGSETRYRLTFEGPEQTQRATAADALGADIYWAAGFQTPCHRVVYVDPDRLVLAEGATKENASGEERPMTEEDVEAITAHTTRLPEGRLRALASERLRGEPLGPFSYEGTREGDPNDVVPHQHRRELRGSKLLAAWINHFDVRQRHTHTSFISPEDSPLGYVQHFLVDFGDAFGSTGPAEGVTRRFGYSYYVDWGDILVDLLTLGLIERPWHQLAISEEAPIFGFYGVAHFEPEEWKAGFPNLAFQMMDDRDAFWATNIISRFSDAHIRRLVDQAKFTEEAYSRYLARTLIGRRDAIVETYFREMSPLVEPAAGSEQFCVSDAWVARGYGEAADAYYEVRRRATAGGAAGGWEHVEGADEGGRICVSVPAAEGWPERAGDLVVEMRVRRVGWEAAARSVRFFLRPTASGAYRIVGILRVGDHP